MLPSDVLSQLHGIVSSNFHNNLINYVKNFNLLSRILVMAKLILQEFHWPYYSMLYNDGLIQLYFLSVSPASVAPHASGQQKE